MTRTSPQINAIEYPFAQLDYDFFFFNGKCVPIQELNIERPGQSRLKTPGQMSIDAYASARSVRPDDAWCALLVSGSNAAPQQLLRKVRLFGSFNAIVVQGEVSDFLPVYSAHAASYGAIPATLLDQEGARARLPCILVPRSLLPALHRSERIGRNYDFFEIATSFKANRTGAPVQELHAYLSRYGALGLPEPRRLSAFEADAAGPWPACTQREILREVSERLGLGLSPFEFSQSLCEEVARDRLARALASAAHHPDPSRVKKIPVEV